LIIYDEYNVKKKKKKKKLYILNRSSELTLRLIKTGKSKKREPVKAVFQHMAFTEENGSKGQMKWTQQMNGAVAVRVDMALAPSTLRGFRPSFGIWVAYFEECMPSASGNPLMRGWTTEAQVDLLCLYMLWCNGDWVPDSGTTSTLRGVSRSEASGLANVNLLSQGLEHEFTRMGAATEAFSSKRFRRVKSSYHMDPREQSKRRDANVKLPANWAMLDWVTEIFDRLTADPEELEKFHTGLISEGKDRGVDIAMTALGMENSVINVSRVGEYACTGTDSKHMLRMEDVSFWIKRQVSGRDDLMYANELKSLQVRIGRILTIDDIAEAVFMLRTSKTEQLGGKTRVTTIIPNTPRAKAFLSRVLIWIQIQEGEQLNEDMFFQRAREGRTKRLMSFMVNYLWKVVAVKFNLPVNALSSKSAKQMGIAILDSLHSGKAPPAASFHKGTAAQNHYRHPTAGVAGTSQILNSEGASFSSEQIASMSRLKSRSATTGAIGVEKISTGISKWSLPAEKEENEKKKSKWN